MLRKLLEGFKNGIVGPDEMESLGSVSLNRKYTDLRRRK